MHTQVFLTIFHTRHDTRETIFRNVFFFSNISTQFNVQLLSHIERIICVFTLNVYDDTRMATAASLEAIVEFFPTYRVSFVSVKVPIMNCSKFGGIQQLKIFQHCLGGELMVFNLKFMKFRRCRGGCLAAEEVEIFNSQLIFIISCSSSADLMCKGISLPHISFFLFLFPILTCSSHNSHSFKPHTSDDGDNDDVVTSNNFFKHFQRHFPLAFGTWKKWNHFKAFFFLLSFNFSATFQHKVNTDWPQPGCWCCFWCWWRCPMLNYAAVVLFFSCTATFYYWYCWCRMTIRRSISSQQQN